MAANNNYTVILIGDDGNPYVLTQDQWQVKGNLLPDNSPMQAPIAQANAFGTYLADISTLGAGIGAICIFVNVKGLVGP